MSEVEHLVATVDIGTTSTRAILFNKQGQEIAKHQIEYSTTASQGNSSEHDEQFRRRESLLKETPIFSAEGVAITVSDNLNIENNRSSMGPTLRFPQPGWVECMPVHILANAVQCLTACLITLEKLQTKEKEYKVKCIGIANMRETTLVWSKRTGKPLSNGIVWTDTRTSEIINNLKKITDDKKQTELRNKTGLPLSTYFSASKLRWLLDNDPQIRELYEQNSGDLMFGTVDTWLIYHLTKEHNFVSDVSNASRTYFMDLTTCDYDDELFDFWQIDPTKINFPKIVSSSELYGHFKIPNLSKLGFHLQLTPQAKKVLKQLQDVPINGCLGDQAASLVGQLAFEPGSAKCTYGTGAFLLYNTGSQKLISNHGAITSIGYWFKHLPAGSNKPHFALEGSIAVAGSMVQWLRDNLKLIHKASDIGPLVSETSDAGGVVFVPAFSGLFAPYWDSSARGTILGMTQYTTASHIARAAVEGVCFQTRAILEAMEEDASAAFEEIEQDIKAHENDVVGGEPQAEELNSLEVLQKLKSIEDVTSEKDASIQEGNNRSRSGSPQLTVLSVDGGMSKSNEVMQIQADILGPKVVVRRSPISESTALGAAIAAGLGFDDSKDRLWSDLEDVVKCVDGKNGGEFKGTLEELERGSRWKRWGRAIERARGWLDEDF